MVDTKTRVKKEGIYGNLNLVSSCLNTSREGASTRVAGAEFQRGMVLMKNDA